MNQEEKLWFKAKNYGWGWTPCTWEGWAAIVVYIVAIVYEFLSVNSTTHSISDALINFVPAVILFTLILIIICFIKGEKPEWRWGEKKKS